MITISFIEYLVLDSKETLSCLDGNMGRSIKEEEKGKLTQVPCLK